MKEIRKIKKYQDNSHEIFTLYQQYKYTILPDHTAALRRIRKKFFKFMSSISDEHMKLEYYCSCSICSPRQTMGVSSPYEVDPSTINRTYSRCEWNDVCKMVKQNTEQLSQFGICAKCKD